MFFVCLPLDNYLFILVFISQIEFFQHNLCIMEQITENKLYSEWNESFSVVMQATDFEKRWGT